MRARRLKEGGDFAREPEAFRAKVLPKTVFRPGVTGSRQFPLQVFRVPVFRLSVFREPVVRAPEEGGACRLGRKLPAPAGADFRLQPVRYPIDRTRYPTGREHG